jgi:hypothetical protein
VRILPQPHYLYVSTDHILIEQVRPCRSPSLGNRHEFLQGTYVRTEATSADKGRLGVGGRAAKHALNSANDQSHRATLLSTRTAGTMRLMC